MFSVLYIRDPRPVVPVENDFAALAVRRQLMQADCLNLDGEFILRSTDYHRVGILL